MLCCSWHKAHMAAKIEGNIMTDIDAHARELAAQLIPHTTSVQNVEIIKKAIRLGKELMREKAAKKIDAQQDAIGRPSGLGDIIRAIPVED